MDACPSATGCWHAAQGARSAGSRVDDRQAAADHSVRARGAGRNRLTGRLEGVTDDALLVAVLEGRALVVGLLALAECDLELDLAALEVHGGGHDREALALDLTDQP